MKRYLVEWPALVGIWPTLLDCSHSCGCARSGDVHGRDAGEQVAEAMRLGEHQQHRARRLVDASRELPDLGAFGIDSLREDRLTPLGGRDLVIEVSDLRLDVADLALDHLLLSRVALERLAQLLLRGKRVGQVAAQLGPNLLDERKLLLRVGRGAVGRRALLVSAKNEEGERDREDQALHDSMCLRRLNSDEPEPRPKPVPTTMAAASAATATVTPGANWVKDSDPAAMPDIASPNVTSPATTPASVPVIAPSMTNGPRTIHRGAPTSCMIVISSRRAWMAALMLFIVTDTATNPSNPTNAKPATAIPNSTAWIRW